MSDTDSFIDEVTEEVRRDRLFAFMRRWAWLAVLIVIALVGGTAWREYQKSAQDARAEAFGDALLTALEKPTPQERVDALETVKAQTPQAGAVLTMMRASQVQDYAPEEAAKDLTELSHTGGGDPVYGQIAVLKAVTMSDGGLSAETRRSMLNGLLPAGGFVALLAEEQLALIDVEEGNRDKALERFGAIAQDALSSSVLRDRALQMIVALGGNIADVLQGAARAAPVEE